MTRKGPEWLFTVRFSDDRDDVFYSMNGLCGVEVQHAFPGKVTDAIAPTDDAQDWQFELNLDADDDDDAKRVSLRELRRLLDYANAFPGA